ncbi:MAG: arabinogalactan endo-1,4-beta-galactosidase [Firmicutes bacterium]|nr:arabinogalactan endo-1,4-beta-galactosidase [Bacillota bacterium]
MEQDGAYKVDLGKEYYINEAQITWKQESAYHYVLEASLDDVHYIVAAGHPPAEFASRWTRDVMQLKTRYIRVRVKDDSSQEINGPKGGAQPGAGAAACIAELKVILGTPPDFINGADVSALQQIEDFGGKYYNRKGEAEDCLRILKDHGVNWIRLKVWNNPGLPNSDPAGYNDKAHVLVMARRVKEMGFKLLIDFHYSDWWADPGKQSIPAVWENFSAAELRQAVYDYTYDVLAALKEQGTLPEMAQVGNEITNGMLWDVGKVGDEFDTPAQWDQLAELVKSGLLAVRKTDLTIQTMIHIDRGGDNERSRYFYDNLQKRGVEFDLIGLSYYPIWHGPVAEFQRNIQDLAIRYQKGIVVVETAYPYTTADGDDTPNASTFPFTKILPEYPPSVQSQANVLQAIIRAVKSVPEGRGLGFFYWQPDFIPVKGAGWRYGAGCEWDDQTMFDFTGHALWSLDVFRMHGK